MAYETLRLTVTDEAAVRGVGTLRLRERAQATWQVESGTVRLVKAGDNFDDPGVLLGSGSTFTELYDPSEVHLAVDTGQSAVVQVHVSGSVSA